jgi:hypothetical protein
MFEKFFLFTERGVYWRYKAQWIKEGYEGQYVVIKGRKFYGFAWTFEGAKVIAKENNLRSPLLIKEIRSQEPRGWFTSVWLKPKRAR